MDIVKKIAVGSSLFVLFLGVICSKVTIRLKGGLKVKFFRY